MLYAINPNAASDIIVNPFIASFDINLNPKGPIKTPAIRYPVTLGNFKYEITFPINNPNINTNAI